MNVLVIYDSKSGNTEKMAHAIAEGAASEGAEVIVKKIGEPFPLTKLVETDVVVLGSPVIYADLFINDITQVLNLFLKLFLHSPGSVPAIAAEYGRLAILRVHLRVLDEPLKVIHEAPHPVCDIRVDARRTKSHSVRFRHHG